jgi:hypothetical protein
MGRDRRVVIYNVQYVCTRKFELRSIRDTFDN